MIKSILALAVFAVSGYTSASVIEYVGTIKDVEASYMPGHVTFSMDIEIDTSNGSGPCNSSNWFNWSKGDENNKVVYSTLMTALVSGKKISFVLQEGESSCNGSFIHLKTN